MSIRWLRRLFCRHAVLTLSATGPALISTGVTILPGVEVKCSRCSEFWHVELDASTAMLTGIDAGYRPPI